MAPWALKELGRRNPPRTDRRRAVWAMTVLAFCAALAPFMVVAAVEQWMSGNPPGAAATTFMTLSLAVGVVAAAVVLVRMASTARRFEDVDSQDAEPNGS